MSKHFTSARCFPSHPDVLAAASYSGPSFTEHSTQNTPTPSPNHVSNTTNTTLSSTEKEGKELAIAPETQKLNWKLNSSPATIGEPDTLKKFLTTPPVKRIDLHFPLGLEVTARNLKGVTIKDALDAIHKQFKKKVRHPIITAPV